MLYILAGGKKASRVKLSIDATGEDKTKLVTELMAFSL